MTIDGVASMLTSFENHCLKAPLKFIQTASTLTLFFPVTTTANDEIY